MPVTRENRLSDSVPTWESHKVLIKQLYVGQNGQRRSLREVRQILINQHSFPDVPISIYETRIRDLINVRKKLKKADWLPIWIHARRLKDAGMKPEVVWNGDLIPWKKAWKEIRRHRAHLSRTDDRTLSVVQLPRGITVCASGAESQTAHETVAEFLVVETESNAPTTSKPSELTMSIADSMTATHQSEAVAPRNFLDISTSQGRLLDKANHPKTASERIDNLPCLEIFGFLQRTLSENNQVYLDYVTSSRHRMSRLQASTRLPETSQAQLDYIMKTSPISSEEGHIVSEFRPWIFDKLQFFTSAIFQLSNDFIDLHATNNEDWTLYRTFFSQLPPLMLSSLARSKLRSIRRALSPLIHLIMDADDIGSLELFAANTDHISLVSYDNMIVAMVSRRAHKCLGYFLSLQKPTRLAIEQVLKGCAESLEDELGLCHKVLLEWLSRSIDNDELVAITKNSMEAILSDQSCQMRSKLVTAIVGHQIGTLLPYIAATDSPCGESTRTPILERLIRDAGSSYQHDTDHNGTLPNRRKMEDPGSDVGDKILRLRAHRYLHYSSKTEYEDSVLRILHSAGRCNEDKNLWTEVFLGSMLALAPASKHMVLHKFRFATKSDLMVHAVWHLKCLGPSPAIVAGIEWLLRSGVTFNTYSIASAVSRTDSVETLEHIQKLGADVRTHGGRALAISASNVGHNTTAWLLAQGVSVNAIVDGSRSTAVQATDLEPKDNVKRVPIPDMYTDSWSGGSRLSAPDASLRLWMLGADIGEPLWHLTRLLGRFQDHSPGHWQKLLNEIDLRVPEAAEALEICFWKKSWSLCELMLARGAQMTDALLSSAISHGAPSTLIHDTLKPGTKLTKAALRGACVSWRLDIVRHYEAEDDGNSSRRYLDHGWLLPATCQETPTTCEKSRRRNYLILRLLSGGADINSVSNEGATALINAARNGDLQLAMLLLDKGAHCDVVADLPEGQRTALDVATLYGRFDMVQLLLNIGAKSADFGESGLAGAMEHARRKGDYEVLELLQAFADSGRAR